MVVMFTVSVHVNIKPKVPLVYRRIDRSLKCKMLMTGHFSPMEK